MWQRNCQMWVKKKEPLNVTIVMLVLPNVTMELSNVRKKNKVPSNVTQVQSNVILVLPNVTIEPTKNKGTTKCDKSTIIYDVGTTQCGTVKYDKKKKKKETTKCDKSIVQCYISTTKCDNGTIKYEKK